MEKITVSAERVINTLREVASEHPDYVYETPEALRDSNYGERECWYVHPYPAGPVAGCIVGQVLVRLGVPLDVLGEYEHRPARGVVPALLDITGLASSNAHTMLAAAQSAQDGAADYGDYEDGTRIPWGDAVAYAETVAGTVQL
jgi:hypothetical protein